ncbi:hypothetical protein F4810DRAFT_527861 [Camillea tinctor]|nr:hypothetical protein F4810DRAFT_527861 [Camillea tinctor]
MESKIWERLGELEAFGKPISDLPLPYLPTTIPDSLKNSKKRPPDPDNSSLKGWVSQRRSCAYTCCNKYASYIELASLVLNELSMCYHPAWNSSPTASTTLIPKIELEIVDMGLHIVAANWGCQSVISDGAQLQYFCTQLPKYIFLTKLRLAVDQITHRLKACVSAVSRNTEVIRWRNAEMYKEHRQWYEEKEPKEKYRGLAGGKTSPLRQVVEFVEEAVDPLLASLSEGEEGRSSSDDSGWKEWVNKEDFGSWAGWDDYETECDSHSDGARDLDSNPDGTASPVTSFATECSD